MNMIHIDLIILFEVVPRREQAKMTRDAILF